MHRPRFLRRTACVLAPLARVAAHGAEPVARALPRRLRALEAVLAAALAAGPAR
mgnify:CR=1 FL=1